MQFKKFFKKLKKRYFFLMLDVGSASCCFPQYFMGRIN